MLPLNHYEINTSSLGLTASEVAWDSAVFGMPVVNVQVLRVSDHEQAKNDYVAFESWLCNNGVGIASCRLEHHQLKETMFLEDHGFRFVEMVLRPRFDRVQAFEGDLDNLKIESAGVGDIQPIRDIAQSAFTHERYHVDPRLSPHHGDERYARWVESSLSHQTQELLKISDDGVIIGFFLVERAPGPGVYWHLTAISPKHQGCGYGRRAWQAMILYHKAQGIESIQTTISARNSRVLNLYSKLQFKFDPPEMTFHWIGNSN